MDIYNFQSVHLDGAKRFLYHLIKAYKRIEKKEDPIKMQLALLEQKYNDMKTRYPKKVLKKFEERIKILKKKIK